jgi:hypothetical protein
MEIYYTSMYRHEQQCDKKVQIVIKIIAVLFKEI